MHLDGSICSVPGFHVVGYSGWKHIKEGIVVKQELEHCSKGLKCVSTKEGRGHGVTWAWGREKRQLGD